MDDITIPAGEVALRGTLWTPREQPRGVVLVHPATAVPERLYRFFAEYLTTRGLAAVTYDYRNTGRSGSPRTPTRMRDWMLKDVPAVTEWAGARFPGRPLLGVGHSLGGHAIMLNAGTARLTAGVTVASHAGATRLIPDRVERMRVAAIMHIVGPVLARTLGYVPGRRLGLGEDMPGGVMLEWSNWCRRPGYFFDDPTLEAASRAARVTAPLLVLGVDDDPWATPAAIGALAGRLVNTVVERRQVSPRDVGVPAIGHLGFFRLATGAQLWPPVVDWLLGRLEAAAARS